MGQLLQDKYGALLGPFISAPKTSFLRDRDINADTVTEFASNGTGPLACSRTEATYSISSSISDKGFPDIHTYFLAYSIDSHYKRVFSNAFNFKPEILNNYFGKVKGKDSFLQMVTINKPFGTGTLRLKNKDPFTKPLLDPRYLSHEKDVKILVEGKLYSKI